MLSSGQMVVNVTFSFNLGVKASSQAFPVESSTAGPSGVCEWRMAARLGHFGVCGWEGLNCSENCSR